MTYPGTPGQIPGATSSTRTPKPPKPNPFVAHRESGEALSNEILKIGQKAKKHNKGQRELTQQYTQGVVAIGDFVSTNPFYAPAGATQNVQPQGDPQQPGATANAGATATVTNGADAHDGADKLTFGERAAWAIGGGVLGLLIAWFVSKNASGNAHWAHSPFFYGGLALVLAAAAWVFSERQFERKQRRQHAYLTSVGTAHTNPVLIVAPPAQQPQAPQAQQPQPTGQMSPYGPVYNNGLALSANGRWVNLQNGQFV